MRGALTLRIVAALAPVLTSTAIVDAAPRPAVPEATTRADWRAAGLDGTGCYWSPRRGGPIVFVAAGDKALTKVNGRVVILKPRRDARDLFPFTHDAWWTCPGKVESSLKVKGELDDEAATVHEGI